MRFWKPIFALLLLTTTLAFGQGTSLVSGAAVSYAGSTITSGKICFLATDGNDNPIAYRVNGGGSTITSPTCFTITSGAIAAASNIGMTLANVPVAAYRITVYNSTTLVATYPNVRVIDLTFNFDLFAVPPETQAHGLGSPQPLCGAGASYTQDDGTAGANLWKCVVVSGTNTWIQQTACVSGPHGESLCPFVNTELVTLSTGGTTTDTSGNLLAANSIIDTVVGRVTTTITASCTGWQLGDATTAGRFTANNTGLTAGTVDYGKVHLTTGIASATTGMYQTAAAKVRITCAGGNPGAGVVRVTVIGRTIVAPTS